MTAARSLSADGATSGGGEGGKRVTALLQSSGLFVVEGAWVKARVALSVREGGDSSTGSAGALAPSEGTEPPNACPEVIDSGADGGSASEGHIPGPVSVPQPPTTTTTTPAARCYATRAAVKTLADVVCSVCEAREEALLKDGMPGAQKYVVELEAYRSAIVGSNALRVVVPAPTDGGGVGGARSEQVKSGGNSVEIADDLWRLFGVMETRLYSSPAALGKKPGRIYLTSTTLRFYSKVR